VSGIRVASGHMFFFHAYDAGFEIALEEARALGDLVKQGWKPRRTIVYAAWDGEEPALLGSTEWVEAHADDIVAAVKEDTRKPEGEIRVTEVLNVTANIQRNVIGERGLGLPRDAAANRGPATS